MKETVKSIANIAIIIGSIIATIVHGFGLFSFMWLSIYSLIVIGLVWLAFYFYYTGKITDNITLFILAIASAYSNIAFIGYLLYYVDEFGLFNFRFMQLNQIAINRFVPLCVKAGILSMFILFITKILLFKIPVIYLGLLIVYIVFYKKAYIQRDRNFLIAAVIVSAIFSIVSFVAYGVLLLMSLGLVKYNYYEAN